MPSQLLLLELNEVNFEFLRSYCDRGKLPELAKLISKHGFSTTTSETEHQNLEPWIQWVTAHTGMSFGEHGVFRLGDIIEREIPQVWELLEDQGLKVGAVCPMNAKHRARNPAFFIPDPWTRTSITANATLRHLHTAVMQAVNDNAAAGLSVSSMVALIRGLARYGRPVNYVQYLRFVLGSVASSWRKPMVLDLMLADVFIGEVQRTRPDFASLFLNAAAHIQHHYMFSADVYPGKNRNPDWYLRKGADPLLEVYALYDRIVGHVRKTFPHARLMLATGLHQVPHEDITFYWRLRDHAAFMRLIGLEFERVEPRMSRDFLVVFASKEAAAIAEDYLAELRHEDGTPLFEVDNRGADLFVMLTYSKEILRTARFSIGQRDGGILSRHVAFVALKNGEHDGTGYFLDTGSANLEGHRAFPLTQLVAKIAAALGVNLDADIVQAP